MKKKYIFVCQIDETGQIFAGRQNDVDAEIRNYETKEIDLPFSVIAKIEEPSFGLTVGFDDRLIEWYDKKNPDVELKNEAVLAIIEIIR